MSFGTDADVGAAARCVKPGDCEAARSGAVVFDRFEDGRSAAGRYELTFKNGDVVKGTFDVKWCLSRMLCG